MTGTPEVRARPRLCRSLVTFAMTLFSMEAVAANTPSVRVATYNIERLGPSISAEYKTLAVVLRRINADIVMLQEVFAPSGEVQRIDRLARDAGYSDSCVSETSGTLSGSLHNAVLSKFPLLECVSYSAAELSGDRQANDITRDVLLVVIDVAPPGPAWGIFTTHFKAGADPRNRFRRQVEMRRVVQAIDRFHALRPRSPVVITGDFNEDIEDGPFGEPSLHSLPDDLPVTYRLGADMSWPIVYAPFKTLRAAGFNIYEAHHRGQPDEDETRYISGRRLDYLAGDLHLRRLDSFVYDSCDDEDNESTHNARQLSQRGFFRAPKGEPLACGITGDASDHFPVLADLMYEEADIKFVAETPACP